MSESAERSTSKPKSIWRKLADSVDAFATAWSSAPPQPSLNDFVPDESTGHRRLALIELIKVDLHHRFQLGETKRRVDDYVREWPELSEAAIPPDLLFEEIQLRRRAGEKIDIAEYSAQYPAAEKPLTHLEKDQSGIETTAILAMRKTNKRFKPGDTVDDFELLSELGKGGFATVYLARQKSMQRLVALKISSDQGTEPQTLAQLDHPNIVRVYDQRQIPESTNKNQRLLYMQYVPGGTLMDALARMKSIPFSEWTGATFVDAVDQHLTGQGQMIDQESTTRKLICELTWPQVVARIGRQLATALDYAHKKGVLHRDLKPANVLLSAECGAKLVDFNVSCCSKVEGASPAAYFGGSLPYMSPEQIEACNPEFPRTADELNEQSDIFSLGVLLFELLTGERPFDDPPLAADWCAVLDFMAEQRMVGLPRSIIEESFGDNHLLRHSVMKCLEPSPERRFERGDDLGNLLKSCESNSLDKVLFPFESTWQRRTLGNVILVGSFMTIVPSALAAWFITSYNLVESVPQASHRLFKVVRESMNGIAFPLAGILIIICLLPVSRALRWIRAKAKSKGQSPDTEEKDVEAIAIAVERAPILGHFCAIVCVVEWFVAGLLYPVILGICGVKLPARAWGDFFGSHALAGLAVAAYTFFGITFVALSYWQNQLLGQALLERQIHGRPKSMEMLSKLVPFYQMISAIIPIGSVALLVVWGDARNKFALTILSIVSFVGVAATFWLARKIQKRLTELDQIF